MRGRNRPKGPNPLTRSYESNGPDVKLRGTAQHIADKYAQLARDALASGDPIAAENYFQHGEHYFRIITGAQEPNRPQSSQGYARNGYEDEDEGDEDAMQGNGSAQGEQGRDHGRRDYGQGFDRNAGGDEYGDPGQQPQPFERHDYDPRQNRNDRQDNRRDRFQNRNDRPQRFDNNRDFNNRGEGRQEGRQDRQDFGRQDSQPRQDYRQDGRQEQRHEQGRGENRQDFGRNDQSRERDGGRYENGRGDYPRHEGGRQDRQESRQQENRQEGRQDDRHANRQESGRGEQPRFDNGPRRDRRREEPSRAEETGGLPAFLMTATRNPQPAESSASEQAKQPEKPEPVQDNEAAPTVAAGEDAAPAPKPRRRRARYKAGEGQEDNGEAPTSTDASSAAE